MENKYEVEIRAKVDEGFHKKLIANGAKVLNKYSSQDDYWKPKASSWDPEFIIIRIRKYGGGPGVEVLFSHVQYIEKEGLRIKRSIYPKGKITLFRGDEETARKLLKECGFEYWFSVKKLRGIVLDFKGIGMAVEQIEDFGWSLELEGDGSEPESAIADLWDKLKKLGIREDQLINTSLPKAVAVKKELI